MIKDVLEMLQAAIDSASEQYYQLVLLVGESGIGKTNILRELSKRLETETININLWLSTRMLELTKKQRILRVKGLMDQMVANHDIVILDNMEILFDVGLQQDPLKMLQYISRNRIVIAAWNGHITDGKLVYADPTHQEYRCYVVSDSITIDMNQTTIG